MYFKRSPMQKSEFTLKDFNIRQLVIKAGKGSSTIPYVLEGDIREVMGLDEFLRFEKFMGGQTVPVSDEGPCVYPWDLQTFLDGNECTD